MALLPIFRRLAACAALALGFCPAASWAQGDLLVAPTRLVIENGGSGEVVLSNIGTMPATYRIALELRRMTESGDFVDIDEANANPAERAALDMVRYAPRRITLLPGQPQAVRVSVRPPEGLADGEYRVHMSFRAIPPATTPDAAPQGPAQGLTIKLVPIYGITIPIFVRKGRLEAAASLREPHLVAGPDGMHLALEIDRTGQRSIYGELTGKNARGDRLFDLRGIAVYPEIGRRQVHVPLSAEEAARFKGPVKIEYRELPENGGALIAETTATFP